MACGGDLGIHGEDGCCCARFIELSKNRSAPVDPVKNLEFFDAAKPPAEAAPEHRDAIYCLTLAAIENEISAAGEHKSSDEKQRHRAVAMSCRAAIKSLRITA